MPDKIEQEKQSLLRKNGFRTVVQMIAQFEPQVTFSKKLPNVAESVLKRVKTKHWQSSNSQQYLIREISKQFIYHFDFQLFYCQTLGLAPWVDNFSEHAENFSIAFNKMDVSRLKSLTLKITIQLDLLMSHAEICDLVCKGYLLDNADLKAMYGVLDDIFFQIYGKRGGMKSQTTIAPQNADQARGTFLAIGNHEAFVEPKFVDTRVNEHLKLVSTDSLAVVVEMSKQDIAVASFREFLEDALEEAERIVEGTVLRIRALKPKEGGRNGNLAGPI